MNKTLLAIAAVIFTLSCRPAIAGHTFGIIGAGVMSCAQFSNGVASSQDQGGFYYLWAEGFLTGSNAFDNRNSHIVADMDAVEAWLNNYCAAHPLDMFVDAVMELRFELKKQQGGRP